VPRIEISTEVNAPINRVFDLARSIDLHTISMKHTGESAIAGVTSGLIGPGSEVTWRAKHFGIWQELTSRIMEYQRPTHFRDSMVSGSFRQFDHDHFFTSTNDATLMRDVFDFESPFGILGRIANRIFLTAYMRKLLEQRNAIVKTTAESDEWKKYLPLEN
jgi:ligand-binding SRPBCC domain-containing protein